ncbi:MAG: hypothetical protein QGI83_04010 [Candidatus Latescibacteria bacterium]|nr:hypothetical protein [Candidatus Latescibacterota bacterium]
MSGKLNALRDEAQGFLNAVKGRKHTVEEMITSLEEELSLLRSCVSDEERFAHQIYDMVFILLMIAAENNVDLDAQWEKGWEKKRKYM